jgi:hypothetical protein
MLYNHSHKNNEIITISKNNLLPMILMDFIILQSEVRLVAKKLRDRDENPLIWDFTKA